MIGGCSVILLPVFERKKREDGMTRRQREKYTVGGVELIDVRNRNEFRVLDALREVLPTMDSKIVTEAFVRDVYACALNQLPARYAQAGTIVLREPVRSKTVREAVAAAIQRTLNNPKGNRK